MTVKFRKNIVKNPKSIYGFNNKKKKLTIHETDNTSKGANADAHARLQQNGYSASWHYQVDDKEVIQSFEHEAQCFHAGDGRGNGNLHSIGIEICVNSDGNYLKAVENTVWLVKKIMAEEGLTVDDVVQHNHWSGKNCPRRLRAGSHGINWKQFIDKVKGSTSPSKPTTSTYKGNSIVTYLNSIGINSSFANRAKLAKKHGIKSYKGTAKQNLDLLAILRKDKPASKPQPSTPKKSISDVAKEVIAGKWGNGADRKSRLEKAGYKFTTVQAEVNRILKGSPSSKKSINQIAREVIDGKWGNGATRKSRLEKAGYNHKTIQAEVNRILK